MRKKNNNTNEKKNYKEDITQKIKRVMGQDPTLKKMQSRGKWRISDKVILQKSPDLFKIQQLSKLTNTEKAKNIYELLSSVELLTLAHKTIYKNKEASMKNTSPQTVDGFSLEHIQQISDAIKTKKFSWSPIRKVEISMKAKKPTSLGIINYSDKLVQFICTLILNAIYEPIFSINDYNHGFRPFHSTHNNMLKILNYKTQGLNHAIEGHISAAFDNVNHDKLIGILKKKIEDPLFLDIIKSACKCNIVEFSSLDVLINIKTPELGTPQGYIMSPILFNIYMNDFDSYINQTIRAIFDSLNLKRTKDGKLHPIYKIYDNKIRSLKTTKETLKKKEFFLKFTYKQTQIIKNKDQQISQFTKLRTKYPSKDPETLTLRWLYTRYADDFIILTNASITICEEIKILIKKYLDERLALQLNETKTKITNLKKQPAYFLGFAIYISNRAPKTTNTKMGVITRRRGSEVIKAGIDFERRFSKLVENKYAVYKNNKLFPSAVNYLTPFSPYEIIEHYNQVMDGLCNYYFRIITNASQLNYILYLLQYSCLFTLAKKLKTSISKIWSKYGWKELDINLIPTKKKKIVFSQTCKLTGNIKHIVLLDYLDCLSRALGVAYNLERKIFSIPLLPDDSYWRMMKVNWRRSKQLPGICLICGATLSIEMYHTNPLKKLQKEKDLTKERLTKFMSSINRRQIPLCYNHHQQVHKEIYNDTSLKTIYCERLPRLSNFLNASQPASQQIQKAKDISNPKIGYNYDSQNKIITNNYKNTNYKYRPKFTLYRGDDNTTVSRPPNNITLFIYNYFVSNQNRKKTLPPNSNIINP